MKKLIFLLFPAFLFAQSSYLIQNKKQVWHKPATEKTHPTFAKFDTNTVKIDVSTTFPELLFFGSDSDNFKITGNASDQMLFSNAAGGYRFDDDVGVGISPNAKLHVAATAGSAVAAFLTTADWDMGAPSGSGLLIQFGATSGDTYTKLDAVSAGSFDPNNLILQSVGGNIGLFTVSPYHQLSLIESAGGSGKGINVVNSAINVNRTSAATAIDSASVQINTTAAGDGYVSVASKGGLRLNYLGRQPVTYNASALDAWWSLNVGGTGKDTLFVSTDGDSVTYVLGAARAKKH